MYARIKDTHLMSSSRSPGRKQPENVAFAVVAVETVVDNNLDIYL
jgi:hypothetical protein